MLGDAVKSRAAVPGDAWRPVARTASALRVAVRRRRTKHPAAGECIEECAASAARCDAASVPAHTHHSGSPLSCERVYCRSVRRDDLFAVPRTKGRV
ncbi:hypothetical protein MTO96_006715 [Rhipicephalus appendiculatus]